MYIQGHSCECRSLLRINSHGANEAWQKLGVGCASHNVNEDEDVCDDGSEDEGHASMCG